MPTKKTICVLLIDDDPADRELARLALDKADGGLFEVTFSRCLTEAEPHLRSADFEVLLLDLGLPESCGMETLLEVRAINQSIPIVVLTDLSDEEVALECLNNGAQDYLLKSHLALETLSRSVRYAIQRQQLHQQITSANILLEKQNADLARLCDTAQRFVDNVSHDFRTPLTVINEYVALLQEGLVGETPLDEEQQRYLGIVADRAHDLNTMVDDMLDVSKLQAGLLSTWRRDRNLLDILCHLRPALESKAKIRNVQLDFQVDADLPTIYCDGEKLGRVLINLVVNAIKFCGEPGHVCVFAEENLARHELVISVVDNGRGISKQHQEEIFKRFRQLGGHARNTQQGFGLGLSIAKELVDLNLGEMSLDSAPGSGSKFSFTVPIADPVEVTKRYVQRLQATVDAGTKLAIVEVAVASGLSDRQTEEVDTFLNHVLQPEEILFRPNSHHWLFLVPGAEFKQFTTRIETMLANSNRNLPGHSLPNVEIDFIGEWQLTDQQALARCLGEFLEDRKVLHA